MRRSDAVIVIGFLAASIGYALLGSYLIGALGA